MHPLPSPARRRFAAALSLALLVGGGASALGGCAQKTHDPVVESGAASSVQAAQASAAPSVASAAVIASAPPPPAIPPAPPVDPDAIAKLAPTTCAEGARDFLAAFPEVPNEREPLRVLATSGSGALPPDGVVVIDPSGKASAPTPERRLGPPTSAVIAIEAPQAGSYKVLSHRDGKILACRELKVVTERKPGAANGPPDQPWVARKKWDRRMEDLYSAWIEKLFDSEEQEGFSFGSLHEISSDAKRNLLHNHLGLGEDALPPKGVRLDPDCADLPYFLRAYFAWKNELPFGYSACSRGGGGRAPRCDDPRSSLDPLDEPESKRVRRFERFARGALMNTVHTGTGRPLASDDKTDYYAIALSPETLRPGTIYADPYGHVLVLAKRVPQRGDIAGALFAVDGQPDGTVAKKRFWRGNFLFAQDEPSMGSPGWKRFRPVVRRADGVRGLKNAEIAASPDYGDFSLEQTQYDVSGFYDKMADVLSPAPLEPERALTDVVQALEEQVKARVTSVENGEKYFREGGARIDMPNGTTIFETTGAWEDFSTPSRDMRLLIAVDVVTGFPALVGRRPEKYKMPAGTPVADVVKGLEARLQKELASRSVEYLRSDGSKFKLTLAEVVKRAPELEIAFNPNACAELRWGAPEGSDEIATCKRRIPADQRRKMEPIRAWFHDRKRPARK